MRDCADFVSVLRIWLTALLGQYRERFNIEGRKTCFCGGGVETRDHILFDCPLWIRYNTIQRLTNRPSPERTPSPDPSLSSPSRPGQSRPRFRDALLPDDTEYETDEDRVTNPTYHTITPDQILWFLQMNPMAFSFEWHNLIEEINSIPREEQRLHLPIYLVKAHTTFKVRKWREWRATHPHEDASKFQWDPEQLARRIHQNFWDKKRGIG